MVTTESKRNLGLESTSIHALTQDVRILEAPVHRDPQIARHQIYPRFVRLTLWYCKRFLWASMEVYWYPELRPPPRVLISFNYTSALPMGFLPDSHPHKLMINYSMMKLPPYPLFISMLSSATNLWPSHFPRSRYGTDVSGCVRPSSNYSMIVIFPLVDRYTDCL